ncbi:uncharacterized protein LOC130222319 [Danio aesculapii]|uniref:uncharacterized protein LOC130222319 n=1 Tax=Danio aesculapii TaxID=1142201 RepID=UPI0024BF1478|nr:uncharacterized protein LOC130222319 [Danio aesculapii]
MFRKKDLWRHQSSCKTKKLCVKDQDDEDKNNRRGRVQSRAACLLPIVASSDGCQSIINSMHQDEVSFHARNDDLICKYGESIYAKHGRVKSRHQYISQRMRELGHFMVVSKELDKTVSGLQDLCTPAKFKFVVNVAKRLTQFSPGKNEYGKPSTAVKIGFCLKGAVEVLIGQALMKEDDLSEKKAKKFYELLEKNWRNSVSISAHQTLQEKKWNKADGIPLTKNVIALRDHLRMVEDDARTKLAQEMNLSAYKKLNEAVLAQVIIFNKRREGEASRLTLDTYKTASSNAINEDIYSTLSPLEKELSKMLTRIEIRGKRGRKVPVFLTDRMMESINLLVERREEAGVPAENPYLFARPGVFTNIRGCDCLRKYAEQSKIENPGLLRSTKLRKQVATLCQLLDLTEQELEQVAKFMGHDIRVHCDFYRQTDKTFQIAKISKLLFAMEEGTETLRGKNLDTLHPSIGGESPPSTSVSQRQKKGGRPKRKGESDEDQTDGVSPPKQPSPQIKRKRRAVYDFSPQISSDHCSDDQASEVEEKTHEVSLTKPSPQIKRKKKRAVYDFSPQKSSDHCSDDQASEVKDQTDRVSSSEQPSPQIKKKRVAKGKANVVTTTITKRPWSDEERRAVSKHLSSYIAQRRVSGKAACMNCLTEETALRERTWTDVKNCVYNTIVTLKRKSATRMLQF